MSGTRSHSRKAPATEAILVSHGQPSDPEPAERALACLADKVADHLPGWHVRSATLAAPGRFETVLDTTTSEPAILPVFMTEGWFTREALPARIDQFPARVLTPVGSAPSLPALAAKAIADEAIRRKWNIRDVEVLLAAHGSARGPVPAQCTRRFANALSLLLPCSRIRVGFLEQSPSLSAIAAETERPVICLPFFAAGGVHVTQDVPDALKAGNFAGSILTAIGLMDGIPQLVARTLQSAALEGKAA